MINTLRSHFFGLAMILATLSNAQMAYVPGDLLVQVTDREDLEALTRDLAMVDGLSTEIRVMEEVSYPMRIWRLSFNEQLISQQRMLSLVAEHPAVRIAQNNHILEERITTPNDPSFSQQWHHVNANDADIDSDLAWDITTGGLTAHGDTIVVCVIENSDLPHADLIENAWFNHQEIPNNGADDDGNGYVDDYQGWNPDGNDDDVYGGGHGTQVAGMIGADGDNNLGVAGANWTVKIMVVTVGSVTESNVIASYTYPWTMRKLYNQSGGNVGAFVVSTNASWGIDNGDPANAPLWCAVYDSLGAEGILSCGATANNDVNIDVVGDLPTACSSDFMVAVTATNDQDIRTFSGYGATTIDVGAPGASVWTTTMGGSYGSTSGTSFASPLTAGVIGLLYSAPCSPMMDLVKSDPEAGALYVRDALFNGVDVVGNLPGETVTGGRINSYNSLMEILNNCGACPEPYNLDVSANSATDATFAWSSLGSGPFNIRYRELGTTTWTDQTGIVNTSFVASGLNPCTAYEFEVEAFCDSIWSGFGQTAVLQVPVEPTPLVTLDNDEVICDGDMVTLSSSAPANMWSTGDTTQSITVTSSGDYYVSAIGACNNAASDTTTITVLPIPAAPTSNDVALVAPGTATLNATGDSILWWDVPSGGTNIGTGNTWDTPFLNTSTDFWCSNVNAVGGPPVFGGKTDNNTSQGQYHTNASNWIIFEAFEEFTILSVKVYANGAGTRTIGLIDQLTNTTITQSPFSIPDGQSRVQLDFEVPGPGQYGLRVMGGNPQLWRDGLGSNPNYPYALGSLGQIIESTASFATDYYYFFYDWEVQEKTTICESPRVPVSVTITVGIDEIVGATDISAYPNPADASLNFEVDLDMIGGRIDIHDVSGKVIAQVPVHGETVVLNTTDFASGAYQFTLFQSGEKRATGRFSVAH